jgi:glycine/D-amino acid oxidase-like deaminating enzyme
MHGLADKARAAGARIVEGVAVTGFEFDGSGAVTRVLTGDGIIEVEQVSSRSVPGSSRCGRCSTCRSPSTSACRTAASSGSGRCGRTGTCRRARSRWNPGTFVTAAGASSPVLHVDSDRDLIDDGGRLITSDPWGIYVKPDRHSVQGGAAPIRLGHEFQVDPYPTGTVDESFPDMWCAALSHCLQRFEGTRPLYRQVRSGGVGAFTADNFPVFDHMRPNVFVAADSNHGYKMIAVGREIARVLTGEHSTLLRPFRFERFATGDLHPTSNSPYPWS